MKWYVWKWQIKLGGIICWIGWTRRPGWKPWGTRDPGILRGGWGRLDLGWVYWPTRSKFLEENGY